ncbi:MAG: type 1 glutamine amidotransferase [Methylophilus sp.]|nr:type 1 glutamine amidotransferase [Methylophilus sp.]
MKPVCVFRHARTEGAGYLGTFLEQNAIPWCEVRIDLGEILPASADAYSGLVFMGGPMSVNDDLPWIGQAMLLIQEAVKLDIPVLGHCLGGQLMSKALGGTVSANPYKEIGWCEVMVTDHAEAKKWFGDVERFMSFHWHGETFTLPAGAIHLLASEHCTNQAYALGKHLGFQCHIEMTEEMVKVWCDTGRSEVESAITSAGVQPVDEIQRALPERVYALNTLAHSVYSVWIQGLKREIC